MNMGQGSEIPNMASRLHLSQLGQHLEGGLRAYDCTSRLTPWYAQAVLIDVKL